MAIDFLIFGLLLLSFAINLLPLGAFWVTPGLRTTANRFVINLLIINLIGCCILATTLFFNGNAFESPIIVRNSELYRLAKHKDQMMQQKLADNSNFGNENKRMDTTFHCNYSYWEQLKIENATEINEMIRKPTAQIIDKSRVWQSSLMMRCWSIDLAAALGALSVLLVVGDTWMAVRDPLRYHSRISGLRSWILIAMTWLLGIFFGLISALRDITFQCSAIFDKNVCSFPGQTEFSSSTTSTIFSMVFAFIYFVVIILLPFGFVCGMYWRIVTEAKENSVRIRQNGSSPLLYNAINLKLHRNSLTNTQTYGGLQMQIDKKSIRQDSSIKIADGKKKPPLSALPSLSEPEEEIYNNNEIKRNNSVKQLPCLGKSSQDLMGCNRLHTFRQIQSTPNLHKYQQARRSSLNSFDTTSNQCITAHNILQNSMTNSSPKGLSYMSSIRRRISNASSLFKQREESRAARISILVVIMFLVSYLPYGFLVLLQGRLIESFSHSRQLAIIMILLANLSSPFIFAYRNKQVRHGVTRLFGLDARSKEHRLQRNGILLRYGTKARISVRRSSSKVSAYSISSCKYLTPILKHTNKSLKNKSQETKISTHSTTATNTHEIKKSQISATNNDTTEDDVDVFDTTINIQPDVSQNKFSIFQLICNKSTVKSFASQSHAAEPIDV